jgi:hypothetical protein
VLNLSLIAYVLVYAIGIVAPMLTHSPAILNFHLLRSSTCLHLVVSLILASLLTRWLLHGEETERRVLGPLLLLAFCTIRALVPLAVIPLALATSPRLRAGVLGGMERLHLKPGRTAWGVGVVMLGLWVAYGRQEIATLRDGNRQVRDWTAIGQWARSHTGTNAVFLLPTKDIRPHAPPPHSFGGDTAVFEFVSHRQVWVDFIRGAAAMWTPSYYEEWNSRIRPVLALQSPNDRINYARKHGIAYLVEACTLAVPAFSVDNLCVYSTAAQGASSDSF